MLHKRKFYFPASTYLPTKYASVGNMILAFTQS